MQHSVFVNSIVVQPNDDVIVEASNGSLDGPPFVRFRLHPDERQECHIGKRYIFRMVAGE